MTIRRASLVIFVAVAISLAARPAFAQRFPFERSFTVGSAPTLDVLTTRGKIDVTVGDSNRVVVFGTVTVRTAWNVPADAASRARELADKPPVEQVGDSVQLRPPSDSVDERAVTISYRVRVPRDARVLAVSDSGAIAIESVAGAVSVRTQSSTIGLLRLGSTAEVTTGSGEVTADDVQGKLTIGTSSSAITVRGQRGDLHVRTQSGAVNAALTGDGDVDVRTSSSAITLSGVSGALSTSTQSGRTTVSGDPREAWHVSTGSSAVDVTFERAAKLMLDATTGSGTVYVEGGTIDGSSSKRRVAGKVAGGGPDVRLESRSGSIYVRVG